MNILIIIKVKVHVHVEFHPFMLIVEPSMVSLEWL